MRNRTTGVSIAALVFIAQAPGAPRFEESRVCATCHSRIPMPGNQGENVAPYRLWLGSMKANSAHDPYWRAKASEESALNPAAAAVVEDKCLRCHAPAQQYEHRGGGGPMRLAALAGLGEDGVTCTVCHQITPAGLGTPASFTGGFIAGARDQIFGPHADPFAMPMLHHTGYEPVESKHMLESALCGTCHTVITPALDQNGKVIGELVEQAPYLEWLASDFARDGRTCQSCHMPQLQTPSYIAHRPPGGPFPPTSPRTPFGRHSFSGANVRGAGMLGEVMPDRAAEFEAAAARAADLLSRSLRLTATYRSDSRTLEIAVKIENLTGHKLPTAFPSRRMWLRVQARDDAGRTAWESGAWDPATGELRSGATMQPHHARITSPDQVLIYEAELEDTANRPTTSLLRAAKYSKDNRILPRGFRSENKKIAPVGTANDADFVPGSDRAYYVIPVVDNPPASVVIEALYQSIKPSHARSTIEHGTTEARRFGELYGRHRNPVAMARLELPIARGE